MAENEKIIYDVQIDIQQAIQTVKRLHDLLPDKFKSSLDFSINGMENFRTLQRRLQDIRKAIQYVEETGKSANLLVNDKGNKVEVSISDVQRLREYEQSIENLLKAIDKGSLNNQIKEQQKFQSELDKTIQKLDTLGKKVTNSFAGNALTRSQFEANKELADNLVNKGNSLKERLGQKPNLVNPLSKFNSFDEYYKETSAYAKNVDKIKGKINDLTGSVNKMDEAFTRSRTAPKAYGLEQYLKYFDDRAKKVAEIERLQKKISVNNPIANPIADQGFAKDNYSTFYTQRTRQYRDSKLDTFERTQLELQSLMDMRNRLERNFNKSFSNTRPWGEEKFQNTKDKLNDLDKLIQQKAHSIRQSDSFAELKNPMENYNWSKYYAQTDAYADKIAKLRQSHKDLVDEFNRSLTGDKALTEKQYISLLNQERNLVRDINAEHKKAGATARQQSILAAQGYSVGNYNSGYLTKSQEYANNQIKANEKRLAQEEKVNSLLRQQEIIVGRLDDKIQRSLTARNPLSEEQFINLQNRRNDTANRYNTNLNKPNSYGSTTPISMNYQSYSDYLNSYRGNQQHINELTQAYNAILDQANRKKELGIQLSQKEYDLTQRNLSSARNKVASAGGDVSGLGKLQKRDSFNVEAMQNYMGGINKQFLEAINLSTSYAERMQRLQKVLDTSTYAWDRSNRTNAQARTIMLQTQSAIDKTAKSLERLHVNSNKAMSTMDKMMLGLRTHTTWITSSVLMSLPLILPGYAVSTMKEIESAFATVEQVMPEIEHAHAESLNQDLSADVRAKGQKKVNDELNVFIDIASKYGEAVNEVIEAGASIGRMYGQGESGVVNTNLLTQQAARISVADNFPMIQATKGLESALSQFGLQTEDTNQLLINSNRIIDVWTMAAHRGAASANDLTQGVQQAGAAAHQAGVSFEFLNALIATGVRATGKTGNEIGTSIKSFLNSMQSDKSIAALKDFGVNVYKKNEDGTTSMRSMEDIILDVSRMLQTTDKNASSLLLTLSGGKFQVSKLTAILRDYKELVRMTGLLNSKEVTGFTDEQIEIQMNTLMRKSQMLKSDIQGLFMNIGMNGGLDSIKTLITHMDRLVVGVQQLDASWGDWVKDIVIAGVALKGLPFFANKVGAAVGRFQAAKSSYQGFSMGQVARDWFSSPIANAKEGYKRGKAQIESRNVFERYNPDTKDDNTKQKSADLEENTQKKKDNQNATKSLDNAEKELSSTVVQSTQTNKQNTISIVEKRLERAKSKEEVTRLNNALSNLAVTVGRSGSQTDIARVATLQKTAADKLASISVGSVEKSTKTATLAMKGATVAAKTQAVAMTALATVGRGLSAVFAALGGPMGLFILAISVALPFILEYIDGLGEAKNAQKDFFDSLDEETAKQEEINNRRVRAIETAKELAEQYNKLVDTSKDVNQGAEEQQKAAENADATWQAIVQTMSAVGISSDELSATLDENGKLTAKGIEQLGETAKQETINQMERNIERLQGEKETTKGILTQIQERIKGYESEAEALNDFWRFYWTVSRAVWQMRADSANNDADKMQQSLDSYRGFMSDEAIARMESDIKNQRAYAKTAQDEADHESGKLGDLEPLKKREEEVQQQLNNLDVQIGTRQAILEETKKKINSTGGADAHAPHGTVEEPEEKGSKSKKSKADKAAKEAEKRKKQQEDFDRVKEKAQLQVIDNYRASNEMATMSPTLAGAAISSGNFDIDNAIMQASQKYGIDPNLLHALVQKESSYDVKAPGGGLTQVSADKLSGADVYDVYKNIDAGAKYFKEMLELAGGDYYEAYIKYNEGPHGSRSGEAKGNATKFVNLYNDILNGTSAFGSPITTSTSSYDTSRPAPIQAGIYDTNLEHTDKNLHDKVDALNTWFYNKYGMDLQISGGWRSKEYNAQVNGSPTSHHLTGNALDVVIPDSLSAAEVEEVKQKAREMSFNSDGEDMYHDRGSGYHLHLTNPDGTGVGYTTAGQVMNTPLDTYKRAFTGLLGGKENELLVKELNSLKSVDDVYKYAEGHGWNVTFDTPVEFGDILTTTDNKSYTVTKEGGYVGQGEQGDNWRDIQNLRPTYSKAQYIMGLTPENASSKESQIQMNTGIKEFDNYKIKSWINNEQKQEYDYQQKKEDIQREQKRVEIRRSLFGDYDYSAGIKDYNLGKQKVSIEKANFAFTDTNAKHFAKQLDEKFNSSAMLRGKLREANLSDWRDLAPEQLKELASVYDKVAKDGVLPALTAQFQSFDKRAKEAALSFEEAQLNFKKLIGELSPLEKRDRQLDLTNTDLEYFKAGYASRNGSYDGLEWQTHKYTNKITKQQLQANQEYINSLNADRAGYKQNLSLSDIEYEEKKKQLMQERLDIERQIQEVQSDGSLSSEEQVSKAEKLREQYGKLDETIASMGVTVDDFRKYNTKMYEDATKTYQQAMIKRFELEKQQKDTASKMTRQTKETLSSMFYDLIKGGKSFKDIWTEIWNDIANVAIQRLMGIPDATSPWWEAISNMLGLGKKKGDKPTENQTQNTIDTINGNPQPATGSVESIANYYNQGIGQGTPIVSKDNAIPNTTGVLTKEQLLNTDFTNPSTASSILNGTVSSGTTNPTSLGGDSSIASTNMQAANTQLQASNMFSNAVNQELANTQQDTLNTQQGLVNATQETINTTQDSITASTNQMNSSQDVQSSAQNLQASNINLQAANAMSTNVGASTGASGKATASFFGIIPSVFNLFEDGGALPRFKLGGYVPKFATGGSPVVENGGMIKGAGTGTSDSILAYLAQQGKFIGVSNGEYIMNAKATRNYRGILEQMNLGKFASGGSIAPEPYIPVLKNSKVVNNIARTDARKKNSNERLEALMSQQNALLQGIAQNGANSDGGGSVAVINTNASKQEIFNALASDPRMLQKLMGNNRRNGFK